MKAEAPFPSAPPPRVAGGLGLRGLLGLCVITAIYLLFELAFNARLLDVVGGAATFEQIHHIEIYGRLLSGTAIALVVLQLLMSRRLRSPTGSPGVLGIVFWCLLTGGVSYIALQIVVDVLVERSSPEFRRQSLNLILVQRALVDGSALLEGLDDDPKLYARPEGKAFLALFPVLATSVDRLQEKMRDAKLMLVRQQIDRTLGGAGGYYRKYEEAMNELRQQWTRYATGRSIEADNEVARQQDAAWNDYLRDLRRYGWTPATVPPKYRSRIVKKVHSRVPVPTSWDPSDKSTFHAAVETIDKAQ